MKFLKFLLLSFTFSLFCACLPVEYKFSKNYTDKLTINQPFVVFDFRTTDLDNPNLKEAIREVLIQRKLKFDTLTLTPLTYFTQKDVSGKIFSHNSDYVFVVSPLENKFGHVKEGAILSTQEYLMEIRKNYDSVEIKKCILKIPLYNKPSDIIQIEQIRHALNQFLDY